MVHPNEHHGRQTQNVNHSLQRLVLNHAVLSVSNACKGSTRFHDTVVLTKPIRSVELHLLYSFWLMSDDEPEKYQSHRLTDFLVDVGVCIGIFGGFVFLKPYLSRIPNARSVPQYVFRRKPLLGKVVSVGDGDNFHFFHTPGGYLAGWGWLRKVPNTSARKLKGETIHVRLCGVDAPERAHFGRPAQPDSEKALKWLKNYILGRRVKILPLSRDQYDRIVADVRVRKFTGSKNVSEEMLRSGWAVVYEGKTGAEFNGNITLFKSLEKESRRKRRGIFRSGLRIQTPGEYKKLFFNK